MNQTRDVNIYTDNYTGAVPPGDSMRLNCTRDRHHEERPMFQTSWLQHEEQNCYLRSIYARQSCLTDITPAARTTYTDAATPPNHMNVSEK